MEVFDKTITYQEVPDKICFTIFVAGCKNNCKNCSWKGKFDKISNFGLEDFEKEIKEKKDYVDVIVFLGGEWLDNFVDYLKNKILLNSLLTDRLQNTKHTKKMKI